MNRLREARKRKHLTMKELGTMVGVTEAAISHYELGKRQPDNEIIVKLSNCLGVTVDYLLGVDSFAASVAPDMSSSMPATPDMRIAVTGPDGMTQTLLHETAHHTGSKPAQAIQQEKIAVLEKDLYGMLNPQRTAKIAKAVDILMKMTDEQYDTALDVLEAIGKRK